MSKVMFMQGLPGSGKSTFAKQFCEKNSDWVRVSRDDLRSMRGRYWLPKQEDLITKWEQYCIMGALENKKNVIVDATNLNVNQLHTLQSLILSWFPETALEIKRFDTDLDECIRRDLIRPNSVGAEVIKGFYNKYIAPKIEPVKQNDALQKAICCDLDGTIAIHDGRSPFEYDKCDTDIVNRRIQTLIWLYTATHHIIFMSGREDSCREKTEKWLKDKGLFLNGFDLYMRQTGDSRKDCIVKEELFRNNVLNKYYVDLVLDDRTQVVSMWRSLGLTCFQVNDGDF